MTKCINGGLVEIKPLFVKPKPDGSIDDPVSSMLFNPSSAVDLITALSLKGFIFKLDVQPDSSYYKESKEYILHKKINERTHLIRKRKYVKVNHFALKFVVISGVEQNYGTFHGARKDTDTEKSFMAEAMIQQEIWKQTHLTPGGEIAPSVGNVTILKENHIIIEFLDKLIKKGNATHESKVVIDFLQKVYDKNKGFKLGILLMKNYKDSKTYKKYIDEFTAISKTKVERGELILKNGEYIIAPDVEFEKLAKTLHTITLNILIKVVRLALLGYIHLDLHAGNILIDSNNNSCVIIDYGRAVSIKTSGKYTMDNYVSYISERVEGRYSGDRLDLIIDQLPLATDKLNELLSYLTTINMNIKNQDIRQLTSYLTPDMIKTVVTCIINIDKHTQLIVFGKYNPVDSFNVFSDDNAYTVELANMLVDEISTRPPPKTQKTLRAIKEEEEDEDEDEGLSVKTGGGKKTIKKKAKTKGISPIKFKTKKRRLTKQK